MTEQKRLRIVHYLPAIRLEEGGVVRAVVDLCAVLARRGNEVTLVTWDDKDVPPEWKTGGDGVPTVVKIDGPVLGPFLGRKSLGAAKEVLERCEMLHLHAPWIMSNLQWAKPARQRGVPYVLTVHGMLDTWSMAQKGFKKRLVHWLLIRRFMEGAARLHCTAEGELEQVKHWFSGDKHHIGVVLPLVVNLSEFKVLPGEEPARAAYDALKTDVPKILFLSRLHPKKGVEHLIGAGKRLQAEGIPCKILIAGSGDVTYEAMVRSLDSNAVFLGMVKGVEKTSLYQAADVFVLPTSQENFGLAIVEAMACGTPVITTKGVDIWPEISRAGAVIVGQSDQEIAAALKSLLADRAKLKAMGGRQREFVFDWLDVDRVAWQYEQMYRDVIAERR